MHSFVTNVFTEKNENSSLVFPRLIKFMLSNESSYLDPQIQKLDMGEVKLDVSANYRTYQEDKRDLS